MDPVNTLKAAWSAVEEAGIPPALHEVAFREAVRLLMGPDAPRALAAATPSVQRTGPTEGPDQDFYVRLAAEAGVAETALREILYFDPATDGIEVIAPTRKLGGSLTEQAKAVISLVSGARHGGLSETSIPLDEIREACRRKNCYDGKNFVSYHIASLNGVRAIGKGASSVVVLTPRWVEEFASTVDRLSE